MYDGFSAGKGSCVAFENFFMYELMIYKRDNDSSDRAQSSRIDVQTHQTSDSDGEKAHERPKQKSYPIEPQPPFTQDSHILDKPVNCL